MKIIQHNKLVRDNIIDIIESKGLRCSYDTLTTEEYKIALLDKLREEIDELETSINSGNPNDIIDEITDIISVLDYIVIGCNIDINYLQKYCQNKLIDKGGFGKRIFLKWVEKE
jgi:predicted house-cleaning noncanonical NTP pyrophosphatase (MazG superfamily)